MTDDRPNEGPEQPAPEQPAEPGEAPEAAPTQPEPAQAPQAEAPQAEAPQAEPAGTGPTPGYQAPGWESPAPEPPIAGLARRNGLVRPTEGRLIAGVCAGFGRATNTDPILWRVILAVLAIFGVGILIYLIGWLLMPSDQDTGAPLEAVFGRGRSATPTILTIVIGIITVVSLAFMIGDQPRPFALALLAIGGVALLLVRDQRGGHRPAPVPPPAPYAPPTAAYAAPPAAPPTQTPFAPHGPYAPLPPPPPVPPVGTAPRQKPPKPPRSRLFRFTLSLVLIAVGLVGLFDLTAFHLPAAAYFAAALAAVGVGLVVGAWYGRSRGLIALGILLTLALIPTSVVDDHDRDWWRSGGSANWHPATVAEIQPVYKHGLGDAELDLTDVDFTGHDVTIRVELDAGSFRIDLPDEVDVVVDAHVDLGHAQVFDQEWGGVGGGTRKITDEGTDGKGGGMLTINANVDLGDLEVDR